MELGGKSPFVIFDDANLERALDAAVFMIFSNNGERCTAGSRILVQQSIYADFVAKFVERAKRIAVGDPLDEKTIVGPMISQAHLSKVRSLHRAGSEGGRHAALRRVSIDLPTRPSCPARVTKGNFVWPTVFADVGQPHAHRAGRNLRPGGLPDSFQATRPTPSSWPTTSSTVFQVTSGRKTWAVRTGWPLRSRRACVL